MANLIERFRVNSHKSLQIGLLLSQAKQEKRYQTKGTIFWIQSDFESNRRPPHVQDGVKYATEDPKPVDRVSAGRETQKTDVFDPKMCEFPSRFHRTLRRLSRPRKSQEVPATHHIRPPSHYQCTC